MIPRAEVVVEIEPGIRHEPVADLEYPLAGTTDERMRFAELLSKVRPKLRFDRPDGA